MSRPEPKLTFARSAKRGLSHVERADVPNRTLCGKDSSKFVPVSVERHKQHRYTGTYCWVCHVGAKAITSQHPAIDP